MKLKMNNWLTRKIGMVSWEMYVVHRMILGIIRGIVTEYVGLQMFAMIVSIIAMAGGIYFICNIGKILKESKLYN